MGLHSTGRIQILLEVANEGARQLWLTEEDAHYIEGREHVKDELPSGRPSPSKTDENVERARALVRSDRCLTIRMISEQHGHSIPLKAPSKEEELIYKRYIGLGINAGIYSQQDVNPEQLHVRKPISYFSSSSSSRSIPEPFVDATSATKYSHYIELTLRGPTQPTNNDHSLYKSYVQHLAKHPNPEKKNEEVWLPKIDPIGGTVV